MNGSSSRKSEIITEAGCISSHLHIYNPNLYSSLYSDILDTDNSLQSLFIELCGLLAPLNMLFHFFLPLFLK